ncbi:MAG: hypothetical protein ACK552_24270, partial [Microcystis sp.]
PFPPVITKVIEFLNRQSFVGCPEQVYGSLSLEIISQKDESHLNSTMALLEKNCCHEESVVPMGIYPVKR